MEIESYYILSDKTSSMNKKKPGRPSLDKGESKKTSVRLPFKIWRKICRLAKAKGIRASEWIRLAVEEKIQRDSE